MRPMFGIPASVLALVLVWGVFIAIGMFHRRWLLAGVLAFYPAALVYLNLPAFAPKTNVAAIGTFLALFAACWWAVSPHVSGEWSGGFSRNVGLALAALCLVVALWLFVVPAFGTVFALASAVEGPAKFLGLGGLLLAPIVGFLVRII